MVDPAAEPDMVIEGVWGKGAFFSIARNGTEIFNMIAEGPDEIRLRISDGSGEDRSSTSVVMEERLVWRLAFGLLQALQIMPVLPRKTDVAP